MIDHFTLRSGAATAVIARRGAELCSLTTAANRQLLWEAGPSWPRHAPVLFPVIGRMVSDSLLHNGIRYPMPQHGFARDTDFELLNSTADAVRLRLSDTPRTRQHFPFTFRLDVEVVLDRDGVTMTYRVGNAGSTETLPCSLGVHPALRWPLVDGTAKADHLLRFNRPEPAPIRRVDEVLLRQQRYPSPVTGTLLRLRPQLFADGAVIFEQLTSDEVRYEYPRGEGVALSWTGFEQLAVWSPVIDTALLCVEPWYGLPSPARFDGEYVSKPAQMMLDPGQERWFTMQIRPTNP